MSLNTFVVISGSKGFTLSATGFTNPSYVGASDGAVAASTGFDIRGAGYLVLGFSGTYSGQSVVHEQTLDESGVTGWFSVQGTSNTGLGASSTVSATGLAYIFPVYGLRHRIRVIALSTGSISVAAMISQAGGSGGSAGGGGGGGGAVTIADGADFTQGAVADAAYAGSGSATVVALLKGIYTASVAGGAVTVANGADVTQGAIADAAWTSGSGTVVALLKAIATKAITPPTQAVTVADGADVAQGAVADAAWASGNGTMIALLKTIATQVLSTAAQLVIPGGRNYETVAASQTAQVLGASGATGDVIDGVLVIPATTSPGNVLLLDNATSITIFTGGATSVSNLVPFFVPLGAASVSGAWKLTTGSNVSAIGVGKFS